jgi:hypothetical protein
VSAASGGRRGRKAGCPPEVVRRMYELHYLDGLSYQDIALVLIADRVEMPMGGLRWTKWSVRQKMYSAYGQAIGAELGLPVYGGSFGEPLRSGLVGAP